MPVQGLQSSMPMAQTSVHQAGLKAQVGNQETYDMIQSMINMNLCQNFAEQVASVAVELQCESAGFDCKLVFFIFFIF